MFEHWFRLRLYFVQFSLSISAQQYISYKQSLIPILVKLAFHLIFFELVLYVVGRTAIASC